MPPFQLPPQQINFLIVGISIAVTIYLMVKGIQWWSRRRRANVIRPVRRKAAPSSPPEKLRSTEQTIPSADEIDVSAPLVERNYSSRTLASFWSVEPKGTEKKQNLFEDVGVEYPYATDQDYRFGALTPAMAAAMPISDKGRYETRKLLKNAGYFEPHAWENFAARRYLWMVLPLLLFGVLLIVAPERFEPWLIAGLVIGPALGWALPALTLRSRAAERLRQIEIAMPDMLDLLNMCVSQGTTVINALARISREFASVYPALSKELRIVADQARVGSLSQALNNFSDRVDVPEVHSFTSLLIQTEQMGTSVSEALVEYSDGMREGQRQRADEKANSATFKLLFPTVLCLMPAVFLLLMGPAIIELNRFFSRGGVRGLNNPANQISVDR